MTRLHVLAMLLSLGLVAACGGGGSGGDDSGGDAPGGGDPGGGDPGDDGGGTQVFSLSGTITASSNDQADSDTNEPSTPSTPNDSFGQAQAIANPGTAGGYVNQPGNGEFGATFADGDVSDFYRVDLVEGQRVGLSIADSGDLDLYLFPASCADGACARNDCSFHGNDLPPGAVAGSAGSAERESLTAPDDGRYFVQACAFSGASNYVMSIGRAAATVARAGGMDAAFAPGEIVVRFRDNRLSSSSASGPGVRAAALGLRALAGRAGRPMLMGMGAADRASTLAALGVDVAEDRKRAVLAARGGRALEKYDTLRAIEALASRADVVYAEPNYMRQPLAVPDDEFYEFQWHYPLIGLPRAWDITTGTDRTTVAVVDSGIRGDHPDFPAAKLVDGYDFISDPENAVDGDGIDDDPFDPGDGTDSTASSFHGTHVAGTVGAQSDNGTGVAGVSWGTRIMPLRALGKLGGSSFDVAQAIRYAADLENDAGVRPRDGAADVINLSLGGPDAARVTEEAVRDARAAGSLIVAAAGNDAAGSPFYPAAYADVISVSAIDINEGLAPYSNFGDTIAVAAPGGDMSADRDGDGFPDGVLSTLWNESASEPVYGFLQGTSMATPHVAGVLALMYAVNVDLTPDDVDAMLQSGVLTDDIGPTGRDDSFGYGLINARKAVEAARSDEGGGSGEPGPELVVSPGSLFFGALASGQRLTATNDGGGTLTGVVATVNGSPGWLAVSEADGGGDDGTWEFTARVTRADLSEGTYNAEILVSSDANDVTVPVSMQVTSAGASADAGRQFVLLIDAEDDSLVGQDAVDAVDGQYEFAFSGVPPGDYRIIAGTDMDNDAIICDAGEACGAFPSIDLLRAVSVDSDREDLDFGTGFRVALESNAASTVADSGRVGVARVPREGADQKRPAP